MEPSALNDRGFSGLEAAIVLIAFVVVAAVFSFTILGTGFFTTQKSQEVVHAGLQQAKTSLSLGGTVIAKIDFPDPKLKRVQFYLQLTAGGGAVDMTRVRDRKSVV